MQVFRLKQSYGSTRLNPRSPLSHLKTSCSVIGAKLQTNFEVLDSKMASGLKKIINGGFKRRVFIQEKAAQKDKRFLTERHIAWMVHEYFKVSDRDACVLDLNENLNVKLKNDSVQSFNSRWDETIIAMRKQPEEILENLCYRQHQQAKQVKQLPSLYNHDTVQNGESRDYTRLKKMVVQYLEQMNRETAFLCSRKTT